MNKKKEKCENHHHHKVVVDKKNREDNLQKKMYIFNCSNLSCIISYIMGVYIIIIERQKNGRFYRVASEDERISSR